MAKFEDAIPGVLAHEGGLVNNPSDRGGITNFGISLDFYQDIKPDATEDDIRRLTKDMAIEIYRKCFWNPNKYDQIVSQGIADKVFDYCVLMGSNKANRCLQRAILAASNIAIDIDGVIGNQTLMAVNTSPYDAVLAALRSEGAGYLRILAISNSTQEIFIKGWLSRAYSHE